MAIPEKANDTVAMSALASSTNAYLASPDIHTDSTEVEPSPTPQAAKEILTGNNKTVYTKKATITIKQAKIQLTELLQVFRSAHRRQASHVDSSLLDACSRG
jgi:hypothetical protein